MKSVQHALQGSRWCAFLACLLVSGAAGAQGWPALERDALPAQGGGGQHDAAVLIGIDDYPFLTPVVGAEANIRAWERWLVDGHKVPYRRVQVLVGKAVGRRTVQEAVQAAAAAVGENGTLYLVFAGHGAPADRPGHRAEPHLLLGNTQASHLSFAETGIGIESDLETWVQPASAKGAKVVAVLDACFSGKAQGGGDLIAGAQFAALSSVAAPASITLLTAASSKDITGPLPGASRPAFSYLVLAAMRGWGDENNDGEVTAQEAVSFAAQVMREAQRPERPALSGADVSLGKSGGEAVPAYRSWLGQVSVGSAAGPTPVINGQADFATLAREAAAAQQRLDAAKAQRAAALSTAKAQLREKARSDFENIRGLASTPTEQGRPVLDLYVKQYESAGVEVEGERVAVEIAEVTKVKRALERLKPGASDGRTESTVAGEREPSAYDTLTFENRNDTSRRAAEGSKSQSNRLSRQQVLQVVTRNAMSMRSCGSGEGGTVTIAMQIDGSGAVTEAQALGAQAGTPVGRCAEQIARAMQFPPFRGEPMKIKMPFAL